MAIPQFHLSPAAYTNVPEPAHPAQRPHETRATNTTHPAPETISVEQLFDRFRFHSIRKANVSSASPEAFFSALKASTRYIEPQFKDFYINFTVLYHFLKQVPKENHSLRKKLAVRMLNYCYKFSTPNGHTVLQSAANPIQRSDWDEEACYHRFEDTYLKRSYTQALAKLIGVPKENIKPVTSARIHPLVQRHYVPHSNSDVIQWQDGGLVTVSEDQPGSEGEKSFFSVIEFPHLVHAFAPQIRSDYLKRPVLGHAGTHPAVESIRSLNRALNLETVFSFADEYPNIAEAMLQITSPDGRALYLDISENLAQFQAHPQETGLLIQTFQTFIRDTIEYGIRKRFESESPSLSKVYKEAWKKDLAARVAVLMEKVDQKIMIGGVLKIKDQYLLYNGKPTAPETPAIPLTKKPLPPLTVRDLSKAKALPSSARAFPVPKIQPLPPEDEKHPQEANMHGGFVPAPILMMENWFDIQGRIEPILDALGIGRTAAILFPADTSPLMSFDSFQTFLEHRTVQSFKDLPGTSTDPYLAHLPKEIMNRLEALQGMAIEKVFEQEKIGPLLQISCNRMLAEMEKAIKARGEFSEFLTCLDPIHEEIATLLAVVSPYKRSDFNTMMQDVSPLVPPEFTSKPHFYFRNSGMSCLQSVLDACEHQKALATHTSPAKLEIGITRNNYFENSLIATFGEQHNIHVIDADTMPPGKLDVVIGHFHPSCSLEATSYQTEDMTSLIDTLVQKGLVSEHFTPVIDNTIGMLREDKTTEFLAHHQERIEEDKPDSEFNFVELRSLQKFDMAGTDMYAGAEMAVLSRSSSFMESFAKEDEETSFSEINFQGIMHFLKTSGKELDARRLPIMTAAGRMTTPGDPIGFPEKMYATAQSKEPLQIIPNSDPRVPFFHVRVNTRYVKDSGDRLAAHLTQRAQKYPDTFPLTQQDSFGFNRTTCADIDTHVRITPGLEPEKYHKNYRDYLVFLNDILSEAIKRYPNQKEAAIANVLTNGDSLIALMEQAKDDMTLMQQPGFRSKLAQTWDQIVFPMEEESESSVD